MVYKNHPTCCNLKLEYFPVVKILYHGYTIAIRNTYKLDINFPCLPPSIKSI